MPVKELDKLTLSELWREVKDEEAIWGDLKDEARCALKRLMEASLVVSVTRHLGAGAYERSEDRRDYRNGYYRRSIETTFGLIENLVVPRCRSTRYAQEVFAAYRRRHSEVDDLVKEMFLAGISTRRVGEVLEPVLGFPLSAQTVSNILKGLDREVSRFHRRPLADTYRYLFFDAVVMKAKTVIEVKKRFCLTAYGITTDGKRELIDFRQATSESEAGWAAFLTDLYRRGLYGLPAQLITIDGCPGLKRAIELVFPYMPIQRCWVHKLRNVAGYLPRRIQKRCLADARGIYLAENERQARARFKAWKAAWETRAPEAVHCLGKDLDELLTFLDCDKEHRRMIRTTNYIERAFREVRRRTRPISTFTNRASCERIVFGVISYLNGKWEDRHLKGFTHNG